MRQKGQALITLLVAISVAISVLTGAIFTSIGQLKNTSRNILGGETYYSAETGAEYGLIKLMRDPSNCTGTDSLVLDSTSITITYSVSGGSCMITSKAERGNIVKTVSLEAEYDSNQIFNYCCWKEIP